MKLKEALYESFTNDTIEVKRLRSLYYIVNSLYKLNLYSLDKAEEKKDSRYIRTIRRIKEILLQAIKEEEK